MDEAGSVVSELADDDHNDETEREQADEEDGAAAAVGRVGPIDATKLREEWPAVRHLLREHKKKNLKPGRGKHGKATCVDDDALAVFAREITTIWAEEYRNTAVLVAIGMTTPMASVSCERAFSTQNRIKTKFRSRLSSESLDQLMLIASADTTLDSFDFGKAISLWQASAARKI